MSGRNKDDKSSDERAPLFHDRSSALSAARAENHVLVLIDGDDFLVSQSI